jgi:hypothetical protein
MMTALDRIFLTLGIVILFMVALALASCGDQRTPAQLCAAHGGILKQSDDEVLCKDGAEYDDTGLGGWEEDED